MTVARASLVWVLLGLCQCSRSPEPAPTPPSAPTPPAAASTRPDLFAADPHGGAPSPRADTSPPRAAATWPDPPGWERMNSGSAMRLTTYRVPREKADSADAELAVFYFGMGKGGSVEDNVRRWLGQFTESTPSGGRRTERSAGGFSQHLVEIDEGTYASGMPGAPSTPLTGWALIGAIVETPAGSYFFKLTGPKATVAAARSKLYALLDGIKLTPAELKMP